MKVSVQTLGCKVNQSESASIESILREHCIDVVSLMEKPDICIVNTCSVTAKSDYQSRQLIRKAARSGAKVIATGCYAQLRPDELSKIEGLHVVVGNREKDRLIDHIYDLTDTVKKPEIIHTGHKSPTHIPSFQSSRSRAFLKIQDGCNSNCTYCTVPLARGKSRSVPIDDVIAAAGEFRNAGFKEIVLTGIHIGIYGLDMTPESSLSGLVDLLTRECPLVRFRLSSIEPQEFNDDILQFIRQGSVCNHLHIPLQSGSDIILASMNRIYNTSEYQRLIDKIVTSCPGISIGTDIITGFPGESDAEFKNTISFIEKLPFTYMHIFPYSKRPNTAACNFNGHIEDQVKKERVRALMEINLKKKIAYKESQINRVVDVIVEKKDKTTGYYYGISDNYLKILIKSRNLRRGDRIRVKVISLTDEGLIAEAPELEKNQSN